MATDAGRDAAALQDAMTDAVRRLLPVAETVWRMSGEQPPIRSAEDFWEASFPVSCVALPDLCLQTICRYIAHSSAALPPFLQVLTDTAGTAAGRRIRGACIAYRGKGLLIVDENDTPEEQCFTLMHEGSHFLLDHYLPRAEALRRLGTGFVAVLDGKREPTLTERFDVVLRRAQVEWHSHLFERETRDSDVAETDADTLACLLLAPPTVNTAENRVAVQRLPEPFSSRYAALFTLCKIRCERRVTPCLDDLVCEKHTFNTSFSARNVLFEKNQK